MKTLVVMNEKGGVGKTNLVAHAGWYFSERNRTLVIDLDQQANLSSTLQHHAETESVELFEPDTRVEAVGALTVAKATRDLMGVERAERSVIEVFRDNLKAMKDDYDVCIIDTPPCVFQICHSVAAGGWLTDHPPVAGRSPYSPLVSKVAGQQGIGRLVFQARTVARGETPNQQGRDPKMAQITPHVGIDVSQARLDVAIFPEGTRFAVDNTSQGWAELAQRCHAIGAVRIGLEASGGFEAGVAHALQDQGFSVHLLNPRRVRAFAEATGRLAKNDRIDAAAILVYCHHPDPARAAAQSRPRTPGRNRPG